MDRIRKSLLKKISMVLMWILVYYVFIFINTYFSTRMNTIFFKQSIVPINQNNIGETQTAVKPSNHSYEKAFVKLSNLRVYMYSASILEDEKGKKVIIIVWQYRKIKIRNVTCCLMHSDDSKVSVPVKNSRTRSWKSELLPRRYECDVISNFGDVIGVSLAINSLHCPSEKTSYKVPYDVSRKGNNTIGICAKFVYGSVHPEWLIEWFEVYRLLGVTKVLIYVHELNKLAEKVLKYYESIGVAELTRGFKVPELDIRKRSVGERNQEAWSDQSVVEYDCMTRLSHYKFVGIVDIDEYIIPNVKDFNGAWTRFFEQEFHSNVAGITFETKFHVLPWGPTNRSGQLFITRYNNETEAIIDNQKNIHMPTRVVPGSVAIHEFEPLKGYHSVNIPPTKAVIHHFRQCRKKWMVPINKKTSNFKHLLGSTERHEKPLCYVFKRKPCDIMPLVADSILTNVLKIRKKLNISLSTISD